MQSVNKAKLEQPFWLPVWMFIVLNEYWITWTVSVDFAFK